MTMPAWTNPLSVKFINSVQQVLRSEEYKKAAQRERRDLIGNCIYEDIEKIVGQE
jgi:hypothetical protein